MFPFKKYDILAIDSNQTTREMLTHKVTKTIDALGPVAQTLIRKYAITFAVAPPAGALEESISGASMYDGKFIYLNQNDVEKLSDEALQAVVFEEVHHSFDKHIGFSERSDFKRAVDQDVEELEAKVLTALAHSFSGARKDMSTGHSYTKNGETPAAEVLVDIGHCANMLAKAPTSQDFIRKLTSEVEFMMPGSPPVEESEFETTNLPFDDEFLHQMEHSARRDIVYSHVADLVLGCKDDAVAKLRDAGIGIDDPRAPHLYRTELEKNRKEAMRTQREQIERIMDLVDKLLDELDEGRPAKEILLEAFPNLYPHYVTFQNELKAIAAECNVNDPDSVMQTLRSNILTQQTLAKMVEALPVDEPIDAAARRAHSMLRSALALHYYATGQGEKTNLPLNTVIQNDVAREAVISGKTASQYAIAREDYGLAAKIRDAANKQID